MLTIAGGILIAAFVIFVALPLVLAAVVAACANMFGDDPNPFVVVALLSVIGVMVFVLLGV